MLIWTFDLAGLFWSRGLKEGTGREVPGAKGERNASRYLSTILGLAWFPAWDWMHLPRFKTYHSGQSVGRWLWRVSKADGCSFAHDGLGLGCIITWTCLNSAKSAPTHLKIPRNEISLSSRAERWSRAECEEWAFQSEVYMRHQSCWLLV